MLSTPVQGDSGGAHDSGGAGRTTKNASRRTPVARVPVVGSGLGAGTSRSHVGASKGGGGRRSQLARHRSPIDHHCGPGVLKPSRPTQVMNNTPRLCAEWQIATDHTIAMETAAEGCLEHEFVQREGCIVQKEANNSWCSITAPTECSPSREGGSCCLCAATHMKERSPQRRQ